MIRPTGLDFECSCGSVWSTEAASSTEAFSTEDNKELRLIPEFCLRPSVEWYGYWTTQLPISEAGCPACFNSNWDWQNTERETEEGEEIA